MNDEDKKNYSYLGDGLYAFFDGYGLWLRTGHHDEQLCEDKIYLEPQVLERLNLFFNRATRRRNV